MRWRRSGHSCRQDGTESRQSELDLLGEVPALAEERTFMPDYVENPNRSNVISIHTQQSKRRLLTFTVESDLGPAHAAALFQFPDERAWESRGRRTRSAHLALRVPRGGALPASRSLRSAFLSANSAA